MTQDMITWLTTKATAESLNVKAMQIGSLKAIFTSKDEFNEKQVSAQKSLGKLELIDEIFKKYIADHPKAV